MKLRGWTVFKDGTPLYSYLSDSLIKYIQYLSNSEKFIELSAYYKLIGQSSQQEINNILNSWLREGKVLSIEQKTEVDDYLSNSSISDEIKSLINQYNNEFANKFKNSIFSNLTDLFTMFSEANLHFFNTQYNIELKEVINVDNYGIINLAYDTSKEIKSLSIMDEDYINELKVSSNNPASDLLKTLVSESKRNTSREINKAVTKGKTGSLINKLIDKELDYDGMGLKIIGLYGHVHKKASIDLSGLFDENDVTNYGFNELNNAVTTEVHFYNGKILELEDNDLIKELNKENLDLILDRVRELHDGFFKDTVKVYGTPVNKLIVHFIKDDVHYAIVDVSKAVEFRFNGETQVRHNRYGSLCKLTNKNLMLNQVLEYMETSLYEFEEGVYKNKENLLSAYYSMNGQ